MTAAAQERRAEPLDLHEGIAPRVTTCDRWPRSLRLHSSGGKLVKGRCRATNKCDYCARLAAVEVSELLALDALEGTAPQVWAVLTTRTATLDTARGASDHADRFHNARRYVMRAIRKRWPGAEYVCILEFTTGYGPSSGGQRRPHWNLLLKGIPADDLAELEAVIVATWCAHVDAKPAGQFVGAVSEQGGLMRYLALHFLKESQRPPEGWRGHRVTRSRGYLRQPGWKARIEAQASLRLKRAIRRAELEGLEGAEALAVAELELLRAEQERWECVTIEVSEHGELTGIRPMMGGGMPGPRRAPRLTMGELHPELFTRSGEGASPESVNLLQPTDTCCKSRQRTANRRRDRPVGPTGT